MMESEITWCKDAAATFTVVKRKRTIISHCNNKQHMKTTVQSASNRCVSETYVVGSKSFRPDIQKPRQMENAVRDI